MTTLDERSGVPPSMSRRRLLRQSLALAAGAWFSPLVRRARAQALRPRFSAYPFSLGVASGSPRPDGVVLWTRLAPEPLSGGGMLPEDVELRWEISEDEGFSRVAANGRATAYPERGHSVHVEVAGLGPDRFYFYRFMAGGEASPVGRTRTAPAPGATPERLRFAFASCQQYEQGYFAAYRHMAAEDLDLVVFLGDYIYELSWGEVLIRRHTGPEPRSLEEYRNRHGQYKTDPDLQRMHALAPWAVIWDDHEVDNDYAGDVSEHLDPAFLQRRAAAYQAYFEHMPLRLSQLPRGPHMRLFGRVDFGRLARFHLLDGRQYRAPQACPLPGRAGSTLVTECPERLQKERSLLGEEQERWLLDGLAASPSTWNLIAQQTLMAQLDRREHGPGPRFWTDGWDGYPESRRRITDFIAKRRVVNPLVIGGDVHATWVSDIKTDFDDESAPVVATEICGTSITSDGARQERTDTIRAANPHVRFADSSRRGYVSVELRPERATAEVRVVDDVRDRSTGISTLARFVVESGKPGAQRA